eukprot:tig00000692_g3272.t1
MRRTSDRTAALALAVALVWMGSCAAGGTLARRQSYGDALVFGAAYRFEGSAPRGPSGRDGLFGVYVYNRGAEWLSNVTVEWVHAEGDPASVWIWEWRWTECRVRDGWCPSEWDPALGAPRLHVVQQSLPPGEFALVLLNLTGPAEAVPLTLRWRAKGEARAQPLRLHIADWAAAGRGGALGRMASWLVLASALLSIAAGASLAHLQAAARRGGPAGEGPAEAPRRGSGPFAFYGHWLGAPLYAQGAALLWRLPAGAAPDAFRAFTRELRWTLFQAPGAALCPGPAPEPVASALWPELLPPSAPCAALLSAAAFAALFARAPARSAAHRQAKAGGVTWRAVYCALLAGTARLVLRGLRVPAPHLPNVLLFPRLAANWALLAGAGLAHGAFAAVGAPGAQPLALAVGASLLAILASAAAAALLGPLRPRRLPRFLSLAPRSPAPAPAASSYPIAATPTSAEAAEKEEGPGRGGAEECGRIAVYTILPGLKGADPAAPDVVEIVPRRPSARLRAGRRGNSARLGAAAPCPRTAAGTPGRPARGVASSRWRPGSAGHPSPAHGSPTPAPRRWLRERWRRPGRPPGGGAGGREGHLRAWGALFENYRPGRRALFPVAELLFRVACAAAATIPFPGDRPAASPLAATAALAALHAAHLACIALGRPFRCRLENGLQALASGLMVGALCALCAAQASALPATSRGALPTLLCGLPTAGLALLLAAQLYGQYPLLLRLIPSLCRPGARGAVYVAPDTPAAAAAPPTAAEAVARVQGACAAADEGIELATREEGAACGAPVPHRAPPPPPDARPAIGPPAFQPSEGPIGRAPGELRPVQDPRRAALARSFEPQGPASILGGDELLLLPAPAPAGLRAPSNASVASPRGAPSPSPALRRASRPLPEEAPRRGSLLDLPPITGMRQASSTGQDEAEGPRPPAHRARRGTLTADRTYAAAHRRRASVAAEMDEDGNERTISRRSHRPRSRRASTEPAPSDPADPHLREARTLASGPAGSSLTGTGQVQAAVEAAAAARERARRISLGLLTELTEEEGPASRAPPVVSNGGSEASSGESSGESGSDGREASAGAPGEEGSGAEGRRRAGRRLSGYVIAEGSARPSPAVSRRPLVGFQATPPPAPAGARTYRQKTHRSQARSEADAESWAGGASPSSQSQSPSSAATNSSPPAKRGHVRIADERADLEHEEDGRGEAAGSTRRKTRPDLSAAVAAARHRSSSLEGRPSADRYPAPRRSSKLSGWDSRGAGSDEGEGRDGDAFEEAKGRAIREKLRAIEAEALAVEAVRERILIEFERRQRAAAAAAAAPEPSELDGRRARRRHDRRLGSVSRARSRAHSAASAGGDDPSTLNAGI